MSLVLWWIVAFAAPGAAGACEGPADQSWLAANHGRVADISEDCAFDCLTDDAACAATCVARETDLSRACSGCFGAYIDCTTSHCAMRCVFSGSDMCRDCQAKHCDGAFVRCAGIPIRR